MLLCKNLISTRLCNTSWSSRFWCCACDRLFP